MDCKALSLGELSGQGDGRGPEHRTQANPVSWLRRVYAARWGGGGGQQRAPPRSGAYARQEAPVRALKTHLRCN